MENPIWLNRTLMDVVFEGRHKAYGAFVLRRNYEKNMAIAMLIGISLFLLTINMPSILWNLIGEKLTTTIFNIPPPVVLATPVNAPPLVKPPVTTVVNTSPKPPQQIRSVPPAVVPDDNDREDLPPTQVELTKTIIGTSNIEGDTAGIDPGIIEGPVSNVVQAVNEDNSEKDPVESYAVEQKPQFPGGDAAFIKYITDNLHIPPDELTGQLNILLRFVIDGEGKVRDITVVRGITKRIDQRAVTLIKDMPKWKPGKQNGRPVSVIMMLPIKIQYR